ncbi:piggyBac transposable element-derived protein 4 [Nephila pilipes]|uniref:PiggyBac transposable element-derived protein 4 n=1 Tax=Nephila pilipes TaxID=299642 RepID=A0A8X6Q3P2_NEPPI|nr:piggyBac transposable element-derived protein 4 [Nephila pilipes]
MSLKRFKFLFSNLRIDSPNEREKRKKSDPAILIPEVMNSFISNSQNACNLDTCIDEMLVGFRGKCYFYMYMPQKPVKHGLKVMCLTDARNNYSYNANVY